MSTRAERTQLNSGIVHEDITVPQNQSPGRIHVVRQERHAIATWPCSLKIGSSEFEILNYSTFGIAIVAPSEITFSEKIVKATIRIDGTDIQEIRLKPAYTQLMNSGNSKVAFETDHETINVDKFTTIIETKERFRELSNTLQSEEKVIPDFRRIVSEIHLLFSELKKVLDDMESSWPPASPDLTEKRVEGAGVVVIDFLQKNLGRYFATMDSILKAISPESKIVHLNYFRDKLSHMIYEAPIANRAYNKPLGYAGDFETMNLIYRDTFEGKSLFARCLHKYYIDQAAAVAVKNRAKFLLNFIKNVATIGIHDQPVRFLSLACGPANEVMALIKENNSTLPEMHFTLIDQDLRALQNAQLNIREAQMLTSNSRIKADFRNIAVKNIITRGLDTDAKYHLIYSAGLFDYLSEPVALACIKQIFKSLAPGGSLVIGNFNVNNVTRPIMEYALDWNLLHRTEDDLIRLGKSVTSEVEVQKEPQNINLFLVAKKPVYAKE